MTKPHDDGAHPAVAALQTVLTDATQAIDTTVARGDDDAVFDLVVAFDEVLSSSPAFGRSLAALLAAGRPGEAVEADLRRFAETLEQRGRELTARRQELARLEAVQQGIRARAEEAEKVRAELDELRRLERLAVDLEQLRAARGALEKASVEAMRAVGAEEAELEAAARAALEAVDGVYDALRGDVRAQLARLVDGAAQLPQLRAELATARDDVARDEAEVHRFIAEIKSSQLHHETVRRRLAELTAGWQAHLAADQEIARILLQSVRPGEGAGDRPDADAVEEIVTHVTTHLEQLDGLLRTLLAEAEAKDAHDHQRRTVGGAQAARSDISSISAPPSSRPS